MKELFSEKVRAGKRTYSFDIKESVEKLATTFQRKPNAIRSRLIK